MLISFWLNFEFWCPIQLVGFKFFGSLNNFPGDPSGFFFLIFYFCAKHWISYFFSLSNFSIHQKTRKRWELGFLSSRKKGQIQQWNCNFVNELKWGMNAVVINGHFKTLVVSSNVAFFEKAKFGWYKYVDIPSYGVEERINIL